MTFAQPVSISLNLKPKPNAWFVNGYLWGFAWIFSAFYNSFFLELTMNFLFQENFPSIYIWNQ